MRLGEEETFLGSEKEAIYPELSDEGMRRWVGGEEPYASLLFVLDDEGSIVGGAVWNAQDHLDSIRVVLQLDAIFVKRERRHQGLGYHLLGRSLAAARAHYAKYGLKVVGFLIQTTDLDESAADFYRNSLEKLGLSYSMTSQRMGKTNVTVFLVSCE
jgi:GNAT superfamily N-acetyltransferase